MRTRPFFAAQIALSWCFDESPKVRTHTAAAAVGLGSGEVPVRPSTKQAAQLLRGAAGADSAIHGGRPTDALPRRSHDAADCDRRRRATGLRGHSDDGHARAQPLRVGAEGVQQVLLVPLYPIGILCWTGQAN